LSETLAVTFLHTYTYKLN